MGNKTSLANNGKAATVRSTFSRQTSITTSINADASIVWALLTNAADYPRWNSTVISIDGKIALGEKISLKSVLDPKRTFKLKVKDFEAGKKLVWGDAMGERIYTITNDQKGGVIFSMSEKIGGPLFPLFAKMIPPFDSSFERFAADLKKEAEIIMTSK